MPTELNLLETREPLDWLTDSLLHHPVLVTVASAVGNAVAAVGLEKLYDPIRPVGPRRAIAMLALVAGMVILTAGAAVVVERTKRLRSVRESVKVIRKMLETLAMSCGHPDHHIRANIMLVTAGRRRQVECSTAFNMDQDEDTDRHLAIDLHAGVSGRVAQVKKAMIGDLTILPGVSGPTGPAGPGWGLAPAEQALVRKDLKTILSAPILKPGEHSDPPLLGTLQVDSDSTVRELGWDKKTSERAQSFADVIALHLSYLKD